MNALMPTPVRDLVEEPALGVGRAALLPPLQDQGADFAGVRLLRLRVAREGRVGRRSG